VKSAKLFLCGLLLALTCGPGRAQDAEAGSSLQNFRVRTWGQREGLPDPSVTAILQTRDGYLWVGTLSGLARFDGVKFVLERLPGETNGSVRINALCEDADNRLWIGTQQDGLFRLTKGELRQFRTPDGLLDDDVTCIAADTRNQVWIGTRAGLSCWDGVRFKHFTVRNGLPDDSVSGVHVGRSGVVWVTTRSGMCRIKGGAIAPLEFQADSPGRSPESLGAYEDRQGNLWAFGDTYLININENRRFNYFRGAEAGSGRIWSLLEGHDGRLWIGTSGRGLFCFDGSRFQPISINGTRWQNDVRAIAEDQEGNLWLGTAGGGLAQLQPQSAQLFGTGQDLPDAPNCLALDAAGRVWAGLDSGGLYVRESGRFTEWPDHSGRLRQSSLTALCAEPGGDLWVGTRGAGLLCLHRGRVIPFTTADGLSDDSVLALCAAGPRSVWAGTRAGGLHRVGNGSLESYGAADGLPSQPITALLPASGGGLWIGTEAGVILRGEPGRFQAIAETAPLAGKPVLALYGGEDRRLWIGTEGGGLACLSGQTFRSWTTRNGLPDNVVFGVTEDAEGSLWIATGRGVCRVARNALERSFTMDVSLQGNVLFEREMSLPHPVHGGPRALRSPHGVMWLATDRGILMADERVTRLNEPAPLVYLEDVIVNGESVRWPQHPLPCAGLPATAPAKFSAVHSLEVQFTAPSFKAPERLRFRHKLEGFDPDWIEGESERRVRYNQLPYGQYKFRVAVAGTDGGGEEHEAGFAFVVPAPLWRTPWAMGLMGMALLGTVAGAARVVSHRRLRHKLARLEQQQAMERERMRIAQDMHDEIGSKLTKISFLSEGVKAAVPPADAIAGRIDSIAHTSRELLQTLDEIVWAVNPHNDTLEHAATYLGQYATDYLQNTPVEFEQNIARSIPHHPLSAEIRHNLFLAFEEALNNILKHAGATRVTLEMDCRPGAFVIRLADDGRGFDSVAPPPAGPAAKRGGNGLVNMRERLASVGGRCEIRSQPGQGATVTIAIPLNGKARL
jgi:ligand-binding sensor domain-containing protein/signal transduction histidine kinase